jgi:hypothetical protein
MKERRRRLFSNLGSRRRGKSCEPSFDAEDENKLQVIRGFSALQLEEMLKTSTRNAAYDVVTCLQDAEGRGVLTEIIKWLATNATQHKRRSLFE